MHVYSSESGVYMSFVAIAKCFVYGGVLDSVVLCMHYVYAEMWVVCLNVYCKY